MEAAKSAKAAKVEQEKAGHERATTSEQTQTLRRPRSQAMIRPRGTTEGGKIFQDKDFAGEAKRAKSEGMTIDAQGNPQAGNLAADKENVEPIAPPDEMVITNAPSAPAPAQAPLSIIDLADEDSM